jgi:hypothetical protein
VSVIKIDVPLGEVPVCFGRSHPTMAGAFIATMPYSRSRGVIAATSSAVVAQEYSTSVWGSSWRQSAQRACGPGHRSWGFPPDRVHRDSIRRKIAGIPRLQPRARSGLRHGTINLVSEAPLMFLKLTPGLLLPLHIPSGSC